MIRAQRSLVVTAAIVITLVSGPAVAHAARKPSGAQPGASCNSTSAAINQYCENIPTATGGGTPPRGAGGPPAPNLGTTLPTATVRSIRKRARALLALPAPGPTVPVSASIAVHKSSWSLPIVLLLALIAIAVAGATAAMVRHRRQTASDGAM